MKIAISSGHGKNIRGARGNPVPPQHDEVDAVRKIVDRVAAIWKSMDVGVVVFHDNTSTSQSQNLNAITTWHNKQDRDYDVSVHLNAFDHTAHGTEVLYVSQQSLADRVSQAIATAGGFFNRGPKKRTDLAFLNSTNKPAILLETYFCDNTSDCQKADQKFESVCQAIASSISGQAVSVPIPPDVVPAPEPPPVTSRRTIKKGDNGDDVADLQVSLGVVPVDGDFGPITDTQARAFQAAAKLVVDGVVGPKTWAEVDALDQRMAEGNEGLTQALSVAVIQSAEDSELMEYSWPDRGKPPPGYIPGMAQAFALAVTLYQAGDGAVKIMAQAETGNADKDALTWLKSEFAAVGMTNITAGLDTLRHLFVLLIGLGMRESSGKYCCGRDMSATNVSADTAEAALFQTSWNINNASGEFARLLEEYWQDPNGFLLTFQDGVKPTANDLQVYGSGSGARYQWLSKYSPAFAVLTTALGLRILRQHWGPINSKAVDLRREADEMLKDVQLLVENYSPEVA